MKKNGFTLIELITTFALATVIIVFLINIVVLLKDIYIENNLKSNLIVEQSTLSTLINEKFLDVDLVSYEACEETSFCYIFYFNDGSSSTLVVADDYIKFGNYKYELIDGSSISEPTLQKINIEEANVVKNNSFLVINIPVKHKLFSNTNFGINVVYQYNSNKITL